ncbi:MAG TPA: efflux RND transporter periplasmic adaptor subunit [Thermomicrobiales bacterium]|nr:efflux RND transporter periplasmic adaptor subunit [Thermomicrobiales bacterium]
MVGTLAVLGVCGAAAFWYVRDDKAAPAPAAPEAVPAEVAVASREDVPIYLFGLGTVEAFNTVTVRTQIDGELQKVLFTEGQTVKKGDLLAVIDPRPSQAVLDEARAKVVQDEANLKNAQLILERDVQLTAKQFTTVEQTDDQRTTVQELQGQLAEDQAAVRDAETQLFYTQLTSPIDGRTGIRAVDEGNIVHTTDANGIVVVTQIEPISAISTLSQDDLPAVRAALKAGPVPVTAFTTDGATNLGDGTLSLIDNEIDQAAGTIRLKSTFPNNEQLLWPGQAVQIRILQQVARGATTIPSSALQRGADGFFVYVVDAGDVVRARPVVPGQIAGGRAIIERGLSAGERVVTAGQYRLDDGVRIAPQEAAPAAGKTGG